MAWFGISVLPCDYDCQKLAVDKSFAEISDSLIDLLFFWITLVTAPQANFGTLSILILFAFSALASFQIILWVKIYRRQKHRNICPPRRSGTFTSLIGSLAAVIGIGCAACGAALLLSFLSLFGLSGLLLALPLHGVEIGILGVGLLVYTSYRLALAW